ncbi:MAG: hypothetical protein IPL63_10080 [Saprospiraceae bacterium]|nr:hypothetical protein [Saprospiraceae bacterium]MBK6563693.1 hypothetical protein [Saprospiraceae bacterium]MBK6783716.1 hypothetical protein [Saprospiraceae bacterium]MBK7524607.1 hypothetical protein [Saprospiraceae bacterium]MBK8373067.1 hypothetical protein [Saprospiraceae bacterium]
MKTLKFYFLSIVLICGWSLTSQAQTSTVTGKVFWRTDQTMDSPFANAKVCPVGKPETACVRTNITGDYNIQADASVTQLSFTFEPFDCNPAPFAPQILDIPASKSVNCNFYLMACP